MYRVWIRAISSSGEVGKWSDRAERMDKMKERAKAKEFPFPYLMDETQNVAASIGQPERGDLERDVAEGRLQRNFGGGVVVVAGVGGAAGQEKCRRHYIEPIHHDFFFPR